MGRQYNKNEKRRRRERRITRIKDQAKVRKGTKSGRPAATA